MSRSLFFILIMVGCTKFSVQKESVDSAYFSKGEDGITPSTDKLSNDCFNDLEADACIFMKNPVAQEQRSLTLSETDSKRKFGVKIRGLLTTGFLENARVRVFSLYSPRFTLQARAELKSEAKVNSSALEQFAAYYWSNRLFDYLETRIGSERLPLADLRIYVDDAFTGFSSFNHSIHFEKKAGVLPKALSGEVVIYLVGQALAHSLSGNNLFAKEAAQHNFCAHDPKGCCSSIDGCAQALGNSFGEYLSAVMFPTKARIGESIAGSTDGQHICSIPRDLAILSLRSKTQIYNACEPAGRAVLLGAWYASIWWKLRNQLEAQEVGSSVDVDKLFFDHARSWTSTGTFSSAKAEALRLAGDYKMGKYLTAFDAGFAAAGI